MPHNEKHMTASKAAVLIILCALIGGVVGLYALTLKIAPNSALLLLQMPLLASVPQVEENKVEEKYSIILEQVTIDSDVDRDIVIDKIIAAPEYDNIALSDDKPTVLIYHTHTTEAYAKSALYSYIETSEWRTNDNTMNIVAVGERLKQLLSEYGITALHDTTNHEPPKLATSYSRSVETMEKYKAQYPSLKLFIDVHRDAYGDEEAGRKDVVIIDGKEVAKLMFVVGTGEGATGTGFKEKPDFPSNYALAKALNSELSKFDNELARKIRVKTGRYNQHVASHCLLVEVGHNANTLDQALNAVEYLAIAIAEIAKTPNNIVTQDDALAVLRLLP